MELCAEGWEGAAIRFEAGEMTEILSYLWSRRLLDDQGNSKHGEKLSLTSIARLVMALSPGAPRTFG